MSAANCGIILSGQFWCKKILIPYPGIWVGEAVVRIEGGGCPLAIFVFAPNTKNIGAMYLKLPVYVIIVISFHNKPKTPSKSHIPRIFGEN